MTSFTFALYNRQALSLLEQIHIYLRTYKAERATLILRDYHSERPCHYRCVAAALSNDSCIRCDSFCASARS